MQLRDVLVLLSCFGLLSCSNFATISYSPIQEIEQSESELELLVDSIRRQKRPPIATYQIDKYTPLTLSPGDRIAVDILDGEVFNGIYEINIDGMLSLPYVSPIFVVGKTIQQIELQLTSHLIQEKYSIQIMPRLVAEFNNGRRSGYSYLGLFSRQAG